MMYKVRFAIFFSIICLSVSICSLCAAGTPEGVEWIEIKKGIHFPLHSEDQGLIFEYFIASAGNTHAYLSVKDLIFLLYSHSGLYEYRGVTSLEIGPHFLKEKEIFGEPENGYGALTITHVEDKRKLYSERELSFSFSVHAPYGTTLLPEPLQPHYYSTNLAKSEINYLGVLGVLVGIALYVRGAQEDDSLSESLLGARSAVTIISLTNLQKRVPDVEKNTLNPTTTITYQIPKSSLVKLSIYDIDGRLVKTLVNEQKNAGYYSVKWNAEEVSSGIYFYRIDAGEFSSVKKCLVVK